MKVTVEQLAKWLEEDGHSGCASDLLRAESADAPRMAREAALCAENDPERYDDAMAWVLPGQLREWADFHEKSALNGGDGNP